MQGDQVIKLTDSELLLSDALDRHFTDSDCGGTLVYVGFFTDNLGNSDASVFQFVCEKCHEIIEI